MPLKIKIPQLAELHDPENKKMSERFAKTVRKTVGADSYVVEVINSGGAVVQCTKNGTRVHLSDPFLESQEYDVLKHGFDVLPEAESRARELIAAGVARWTK